MKKILSILKQEVVFIPLMLVALELFRCAVSAIWPETALFDRGSELETFLVGILKVVLATTSVLLILRVFFPGIYQSWKDFYTGFVSFSEDDKRYYTIRVFFCLFFAMVYLMKANAPEANIRIKLLDTLHSQIHVREATGHNDGPEVEKYLRFVNADKGQAWCAAFCSYNLNAVGVIAPPNPKTAWAAAFAAYPYIIWTPGLEKQHKVKLRPKPGDCFTIAYSGTRTVEHVGFIIGESDGYFITTEGNTGSIRDQGVHSYKRDKNKIFAITNYINPYLKTHEKTNSIAYSIKYNFLQPQGISGIGYNHPSRYNLCIQGGQFAYTGIGYSRQCRTSGASINHHRIAPLKKLRIDYKRYSTRRLHMQGFGRESKATGTAYNRAYKNKRQSKNSYHTTGLVYPDMG